MRVLLVVTAFPRHDNDVISPWLWTLMRELRKMGVEIDVLASSYKGLKDGQMWGLKIYRWRYAPSFLETLSHDMAIPEKMKQNPVSYFLVPPFLIGGYIKASSLFKKNTYDIIHVSWPIPLSILSLPFKRIPKIFTFHHSELILVEKIPLLKPPFSYILKKASIITVNSNFTKNKLLKQFPMLRRVEVIPWPSGWEQMFPSLKREKNRILFVGRLVEVKGVNFLIRAFKQVREHIPDSKLVIVGDGPEREKLEKLSQELDLADRVEFKGWKTGRDLIEEYGKASVVVVPSITDPSGMTESLGVVAIEALSFGIPLVVSDVGGLKEVVDEDVGFVVPPGEPEKLAHSIEKILLNKELAESMSIAGKKRFFQKFSKEAIAKRFIEIYEELVKYKPKTWVN
jgi:glycosyltransferase involved in cell wall biosynthesis